MWIFEWVFGWVTRSTFYVITSPGKTYHDTDDQARFCTMASQAHFADDTSQATYHIEDD